MNFSKTTGVRSLSGLDFLDALFALTRYYIVRSDIVTRRSEEKARYPFRET